MRARYRTLLAAALLAACSSEPTEDADSASFPVVGGTPVTSECSWPSTVRVDGATGCTGTLIHPRIVTTAAHCLESGGGTARITFGGASKARFSVDATCKAGANGESGVSSGRDWGYCVLPDDERIRALPTIPPLVGCEADKFLKAGGKAWIVGFGSTGSNGAGFGTLRQVEVKLNRVSNTVLDVGDAEVGACHGDSGGPLYVQLRDGDRDYGFRLAGATSGPGGPCDCSCSTVYVNIAMHVAAIEKNEGIDVTPCTDATGAWAPGPNCSAMQKAPATAAGAFPSCAVARTTEAVETCGANVATGGAGGSTNGGTSSAGTTSTAGSGGSGGSAGSVETGGVAGNNAGAASGGVPSNAGTVGDSGAPALGGAAGATTAPSGGTSPFAGAAPTAGGSSTTAGQTSGGVVTTTTSGDSGCSCAVVGHQQRRASLGLAVTLALAWLLRRRRTKSSVVGGAKFAVFT